MLAVLGLMGYMLLTCALSTLTSFAHFRIIRHDLVCESRRRRNEYLNSVIDRVQRSSGVTVIEDDDEDTVEIIDDDEAQDSGPLAMPQPQETPKKQAA